jgi:protein-disulfide isomerase
MPGVGSRTFHVLMLGAVLAACAPFARAPTATPTPAPTGTITPTVVVATVTPTPTTAPTLIPPSPTAVPTPASLFPPVTESDWQQGPATARVTIVEYGDFQ